MILMRFLIFAYIGIFTIILANEQGPDFNQLYIEEGDLLDAVNVWIIIFNLPPRRTLTLRAFRLPLVASVIFGIRLDIDISLGPYGYSAPLSIVALTTSFYIFIYPFKA